METESKQPRRKAVGFQRGRPHTSSLRGRQTPVVQTFSLTTGQVLERRKEIYPVRYSDQSNGVNPNKTKK